MVIILVVDSLNLTEEHVSSVQIGWKPRVYVGVTWEGATSIAAEVTNTLAWKMGVADRPRPDPIQISEGACSSTQQRRRTRRPHLAYENSHHELPSADGGDAEQARRPRSQLQAARVGDRLVFIGV